MAAEPEQDDRAVQVERADQVDRSAGGKPRYPVLVLGAAALAVLLVGAAVGMLITLGVVRPATPPGADSVDVGFAQDMQVHHLQAVTMANWERDYTGDLELKQLAFDMSQTQLTQVGVMSGWLEVWGQPEQSPEPGHMAWMGGAGGHGHDMAGMTASSGAGVALMPGMATTAELNEFRALKGKELDVRFLQLMLRHHQGGLAMAEYAADHASEDPVRNLAQKIVDAQSTEVTLMTKLLTDRGAAPLPN